MICPTCQNQRQRAGVYCAECRGANHNETRSTRAVEVVGIGARLERLATDAETRRTLHNLTARLDSLSAGMNQTNTIIFIIDAWIEAGDKGEAATVARDFWRVLPDEVLERAGAHAEMHERRRLRHMMSQMVAVDTADADSLDAMDQVLFREMPSGGH